MKPLEERLAAEEYPSCPIYELTKDGIIRCERLEFDGISSNYCPDCKGSDLKCDLYIDYLAHQYIKEKEFKDVGVGI